MACKQERILQFVEAELSKEDISEVKKHLKGCQVCSALVEELRPVIESLREMESPLMRPYEVLSMRQHVLAGGALSLPAAVPPPKPARLEVAKRKALPAWLEAAAIILFGISTGLLAFAGGIAYSSRIREAQVAAVRFTGSGSSGVRDQSALSMQNANQSAPLRVERSTLVPTRKKLVMEKTTAAGNRIIWNYEPEG